MTDCLLGIDEKIKRAEQHIIELQAAINGFWKSGPYGVIPYCELDTKLLCFQLDIYANPPPRLGAILGDLAHDLRSALDHLMWGLYEANGNTAPDTLYFPIAWTAKEYKTKLTGIEKGVGKGVVTLLELVEAYKGGAGQGLLEVHELNRRDKHRLLVSLFSSYRDITMDAASLFGDKFVEELKGMPGIPLSLRPAHRYPLEHGTVLFKTPQMNMNPKFTIEIALAEPKIVEGKPIFETLQGHLDLVKSTVKPFRPLLG